MTAIVLAGGDASDQLARAVGAPAKALVPLKGRPLGAYVLDAMVAARSVRRVIWVGAADAAMRRRIDLAVPGGPRLTDSLAIGLGAALATGSTDERLLIATADLPWLRGGGVDRFLAAADSDHDLVYPVVPRELCEAAFPDLERTWIRLAEGQVTGGNLVLVRPDALRTLLPWIDLATRDRKSPLMLASRLGLVTIVGLLTGRATLPGLERHIAKRVGLTVRAMVSDDAAIGSDVDRIGHLPATLALDAATAEAASTTEARSP